MTAHSRILAWRIPWPEEPGGLQSMGSQRVGNDWVHTYKIPAYWADFLKKFRVNLKNQKHWDSSLNAFRLAQRNTVLFPCEICCERSIPLEQFVLIIPFICKVCSHSLYSNDKSTKTDVEACGGYTEIAGNLVKGEWAPSTHHVSLELRKFKVRARWVGHPGTRSSVFIRTIECKRLQKKMVKSTQRLNWDGNLFPFHLSVRHVQVGAPVSFTRSLWGPGLSLICPNLPTVLIFWLLRWISDFLCSSSEERRKAEGCPVSFSASEACLVTLKRAWSRGCRVNAELCFTPEIACLWSST